MNGSPDKRDGYYTSFGIPIGSGFGVALGLVLANVLDHPGMFALGIALGLILGTTIGLVLDRR